EHVPPWARNAEHWLDRRGWDRALARPAAQRTEYRGGVGAAFAALVGHTSRRLAGAARSDVSPGSSHLSPQSREALGAARARAVSRKVGSPIEPRSEDARRPRGGDAVRAASSLS